MSEVFDLLLHEEVLSYRPLRIYHNGTQPILTNRDNAIKNLLTYRKKHRRKSIYVTECDIQKYFDTINHDIIRECFNDFAKKAEWIYPNFAYKSLQPIVEAYLNSYSFYNNVAVNNEELLQLTPSRMYEGPNQDLFIEHGCYTTDELNKSLTKIGIPQGGALSGLISNIVLSTIDTESILKENDNERFFCRYGDDIILAHTSKNKIEELITSYKNTLTKNKLLYHEFISIADENFRKANGKTRPILWDQKSRNPYLWGRNKNEKESVDWIGFLGYEIRYTGEIRLRRSSFNDKMRSIKHKYYRSSKTKTAQGLLQNKTFEKLERKVLKQIDKFAGEGLKNAKSLTKNKYSVTQAKKLNQYTSRHIYKLLYKIIKKNNLNFELLTQWWQIAKDKNCMNYIKTLNHKK